MQGENQGQCSGLVSALFLGSLTTLQLGFMQLLPAPRGQATELAAGGGLGAESALRPFRSRSDASQEGKITGSEGSRKEEQDGAGQSGWSLATQSPLRHVAACKRSNSTWRWAGSLAFPGVTVLRQRTASRRHRPISQSQALSAGSQGQGRHSAPQKGWWLRGCHREGSGLRCPTGKLGLHTHE